MRVHKAYRHNYVSATIKQITKSESSTWRYPIDGHELRFRGARIVALQFEINQVVSISMNPDRAEQQQRERNLSDEMNGSFT
jgi:hypothetical protein